MDEMSQVPLLPFCNTDSEWVRSNDDKAEVSAKYLPKIFKLYLAVANNYEEEVYKFLNIPYQMSLPIRHLYQQL